MNNHNVTPNTLFTLFGASGDLSQRLILPALFNLFLDGLLPNRFRLLAVDRSDRPLGHGGLRRGPVGRRQEGRRWRNFIATRWRGIPAGGRRPTGNGETSRR